MISLQSQFLSNYEFRCRLLKFCRFKDVVSLMKVFEPKFCFTRREKKERLGLYALFFKDDDIIEALLKSDTKVTIIYKNLDELLDIYYHSDKRSSERYFNVMIIFSKESQILPLYPDMIGKTFGARALCPVTVTSEWYESSTKVKDVQIKLHFMVSKRKTIAPLLLPLVAADSLMHVNTVSEKLEARTQYLHLHDGARMCKTAASLPFKTPYQWTCGALFSFRVTDEHRSDAIIPILA